jgi:hypothetical protein
MTYVRSLLRATFLQFLLYVARRLDVLLLLPTFRASLFFGDFLLRRFGFTSLSFLSLVGILGSVFPHNPDLNNGINQWPKSDEDDISASQPSSGTNRMRALVDTRGLKLATTYSISILHTGIICKPRLHVLRYVEVVCRGCTFRLIYKRVK